MTNSEFSNEFDVLYNSITSNKAPGLDEYEKSVFLTKAQEELVKAFFDPKSNKVQEGFDMSQKRQYDFSTLLKSKVVTPVSIAALSWAMQNNLDYLIPSKIDSRSKLFMAPTDLFLSINEIIKDSANMQYTVSPISYNDYHRCMLKPYSYPPKRLAWRIASDNSMIAGIGGDIDTGIIFRNKYNKPLTINIKFINDSALSNTTAADYIKSNPPTVVETDKVVINMSVPRSALIGFWQYYLSSDKALAKGNLDKYIYPIGYIKDNGNFPSNVNDTITNITISMGLPKATIFEILGKFNGDIEYNIRYIRIPRPIILVDLEDDNLSINGCTSKTECELPLGIHSEILQRAVELAKTAYEVQEGASYIQTSSISATDKGTIANAR